MSKIDKFEFVTNVRKSECDGLVVVESLDELLLHARGEIKAQDLDLAIEPALTSGSLVPSGYRLVPGQDFNGRPIYERARKYDS